MLSYAGAARALMQHSSREGRRGETKRNRQMYVMHTSIIAVNKVQVARLGRQ
jgi:hypothetical protein